MARPWIVCSSVVLAVAFVGHAGCVGEVVQQAQTAAKRQAVMEELKAMGLARFAFHDQHGRLPNSWEELQSAGVDPGLRQKLEAEGYTVVFGMKMVEMTVGTSNFVYAFPRDVRQSGGLVALADGSVRQVTAQEFQDLWAQQEPTMTNAIILEAPAGSSAGSSGSGSAPPPPPPAGSAPPPPPPPG